MSNVLEQLFMKQIMISLGARIDLRIWRQNTGSVPIIEEGGVKRIFHTGIPTGAADISGICSGGRRLEIETKAADTRTGPAQNAWRAMIKRFGGVYVRVRYDESLSMKQNVAAAIEQIDKAIQEKRAA